MLAMSPGGATRFATALAAHVAEAHFKVSEVALKVVLACIQDATLAQHLSSHLPLLLPPILSGLVSQKGSLRALSNECLNECRSMFDPNSLAAVLCAKFNECNDRVKPGALELLATIAPASSQYFGQVTNLRVMLSRMAGLLGSRPAPTGQLLNGIEHLMNAFLHLGEDTFVASVSNLTADAQNVVKKVLQTSGICPEIEERVVFHLRGEKWDGRGRHEYGAAGPNEVRAHACAPRKQCGQRMRNLRASCSEWTSAL